MSLELCTTSELETFGNGDLQHLGLDVHHPLRASTSTTSAKLAMRLADLTRRQASTTRTNSTLMELDAIDSLTFHDFPTLMHNLAPSDASLPRLLPTPRAVTSSVKHLESDIWHIESVVEPVPNDRCLHSWDALRRPVARHAHSAFLSDAGPLAFDAAQQQFASENHAKVASGRIVNADALLKALLKLGLGRSSLLFPLDDSGLLEPAISDARFQGCSLDSSRNLIEHFLALGNATTALRCFACDIYASPKACAAAIALARTCECLMDAIEEYMLRKTATSFSAIELKHMFEEPGDAILILKQLVDLALESDMCFSDANDRNLFAISNICLLETAFEFVLKHTGKGSVIDDVLDALLAGVSEPWLHHVGNSCGLFNHISSYQEMNWTDADPAKSYTPRVPNFLTPKDRKLYIDTEQLMKFVSRNVPEHPIVTYRRSVSDHCRLQWCFGWKDVEQLESSIKNYEHDIIIAIECYSSRTGKSRNPGKAVENPKDYTPIGLTFATDKDFSNSIRNMNAPPRFPISDAQNELKSAFLRVLEVTPNDGRFSWHAPISLTPSLTMSSLLQAQCRILTYVTLHSVFHIYGLRQHIRVHKEFSLLSSGLFASRLGNALFSPDVKSSERRKGVARIGGTIGLKLSHGERRDWPPASSELRLVLMGILSDCWKTEQPHLQNTSSKSLRSSFGWASSSTSEQSLPGDLSFSIRTVSADDIKDILDPHSLHALDFLMLSASHGSAITPIVTQYSQDNYDRAFTILLRLLRVKFVVTDQTPSGLRILERLYAKSNDHHHVILTGPIGNADLILMRRMQHAAYHFVSTLSSHFSLYSVEGPMALLARDLDDLADNVRSPVPPARDENKRSLPTLAALAAWHERTTTIVAANLFALRQQQALCEAMQRCLEDVLVHGRCVHDFVAKAQRETIESIGPHEPDGKDSEDQLPTPKALYYSFLEHVKVFTGHCRAVIARPESPQKEEIGDSEIRSASELLVRLVGDGASWFED